MERKWWTLLAVSVATFMLLLDITVVNVALPSIRQDLGASFTDLQWVVDAYALTLAALVLPAGSLADRLGRRRVFAAGLVIFSVASLLCALQSLVEWSDNHTVGEVLRRKGSTMERLVTSLGEVL
jgi:MFS family permease